MGSTINPINRPFLIPKSKFNISRESSQSVRGLPHFGQCKPQLFPPKMTSYILYVLQVAFTSILVSTTLSHSRVFQTFTMLFAPRQKVAFLGSVVTEYPMVFLVSKLFILYECRNVVPNNLYF